MKKPVVIALAAVGALVLILGGGIAFWALNDSAEDEFELTETDASEAGNQDDSSTTAAPSDEPAGEPEPSVAATWTITDGSEAGYRIDEVLRGANKTATARTEDVSGELTLEGNSVSDATITVAVTNLASDSKLRDNKVRSDYLQAEQFPDATFTLDGPLELSDDPAVGAPVSVDAEGTLELHGVTNDVTVSIDAQLTADDQMEVVGSTPIALPEYDIEVPDISGIVKSEPDGTLEFKLQLTPA